MSKQGNFAQGSIPKTIIKLALPLMVAELVQILYNIVDRMYIGHIPGAGTLALTGIGLVLPVITFVTAFANLCSYGGATLCSIARGEGDDKRATEIMETCFTLLVICGLFLTVVLLIFEKPILLIMGADDETIGYAMDYCTIYLIGSVFVLISLGMNSFITLQGFARMGMVTVLLGAILNIILDPVFIFALNMGIKGAAIATVIAQFGSAVFVIKFLSNKTVPLRLTRLYINTEVLPDILKLGISGFCFRITNSIAQGIVNATLKLWGGPLSTLYIGSMSIINSIREFGSLPMEAVKDSMKPVISFNYGAGQYSRSRKAIRFTLYILFVYNLLTWFAIIFIPRPLISIFTSDEELITICIPCIRAYFCAYFFMCMQTVSQNTFVALNHPGYATFFSLLRKIGLIVPFTIILPYTRLGVMGVFYAEAVSQVVGASACGITMYNVIYKDLKAMDDKPLSKELQDEG